MLGLVLLIVVIILLFGGSYSYNRGYLGGTGIGIGGVVLILILIWLLFGDGYVHAADTTSTISTSNAGSATTTISLLPLWLQMIPYIAAGIGSVFAALCSFAVYKLMGTHLDNAAIARLQTAATNSAGRILAAADGDVSKLVINARSPVIAAEANKTIDLVTDAAARVGFTPSNMAEMIAGKIGQLQAIANTPTVVAPIISGVKK